MKPTRNNIETILLAVTVGVLFVGVGLAWPGMHERWLCRDGLESIRSKMVDRPDRTDEVERLAELIESIEAKMDREFRDIPETSNVSGVVRELSVPVDGVTVRDQKFATHQPVEAVPDSGFPTRAMPLTVDMQATFDAVYALLRVTESMDRLVRVSSLRLNIDNKESLEPVAGSPMLSATIGLEAMFEPPSHAEED